LFAGAVLPRHVARRQGSLTFISSIAGVEAFLHPSLMRRPRLLSTRPQVLFAAGGAPRCEGQCGCAGKCPIPGGAWERKLAERKEFFDDYVRHEVPLQRFARVERNCRRRSILGVRTGVFRNRIGGGGRWRTNAQLLRRRQWTEPNTSRTSSAFDHGQGTTDRRIHSDCRKHGGYLHRIARWSGKLLLCGNGGSAADAQHLAANFWFACGQIEPRWRACNRVGDGYVLDYGLW